MVKFADSDPVQAEQISRAELPAEDYPYTIELRLIQVE